MEVMIFEPVQYQLYYNCSFYDSNSIPVESRRHVMIGFVLIFVYVVCVVSMLTQTTC